MINTLNYTKTYSIGTHDEVPTLEQLKINQLCQIINLKPILARGVVDHLIEFVEDIDPPTLRWKDELLEQMQIGDLQMLRTLLEKRMEDQQRTY